MLLYLPSMSMDLQRRLVSVSPYVTPDKTVFLKMAELANKVREGKDRSSRLYNKPTAGERYSQMTVVNSREKEAQEMCWRIDYPSPGICLVLAKAMHIKAARLRAPWVQNSVSPFSTPLICNIVASFIRIVKH